MIMSKTQTGIFLLKLTRCNSIQGAADRLADELLEQYKTLLGYSFPPVHPEKIAKLRKVKWVFKIEMDKSGSLTPVENGFYIFLRKTDIMYRRNFSCAHEIGHTFFFDLSCNVPKLLIRVNDNERLIMEKFCDAFAEELLMPRVHFLSLWEKFQNHFNFNMLENIAYRKFETSPESVIVRALHLNALKDPQKLILIFKEAVNRKTGLYKKLRVKLATVPRSSKLFVPSNISAERLGLTNLLAFYKRHKLKEHATLETLACLRRNSAFKTFKPSNIACYARYKRYGHHVVGLFKIID